MCAGAAQAHVRCVRTLFKLGRAPELVSMLQLQLSALGSLYLFTASQ